MAKFTESPCGRPFFWILPLMISVSGCQGFQDAKIAVNDYGPDQYITSSGLNRKLGLNSLTDTTDLESVGSKKRSNSLGINPNSLGLFVDAYVNSVEEPDDGARARHLAIAGYDLADTYCYQFFHDEGQNQKWLDVVKDIVAALGTLGTGISALSASKTSTTAIIGLGTTTAYNGIDIYTRNFLYGADNIASVRTLIVNALAAHRQATLETPTPANASSAGPKKPKVGQKKPEPAGQVVPCRQLKRPPPHRR